MATSNSTLLLAAAPLLGLASHFVFHLILTRALRTNRPYPALALSALANLGLTLFASTAAILELRAPTTDALCYLATNTLASLALAFCYFNFVNLTIASLRLRMLEELLQTSPQTHSALLGQYNSDTVFKLRLQRLLSGGHLVEVNGRFISGRQRFLLVARIFDLLRWLILGSRS